MSTTIDTLDIQITTNAARSASNIERLAKSLETLRANAKLTTVVNSLDKLKQKLDGLAGSRDGVKVVRDLADSFKALTGKLDPVAKKMNNVTRTVDALSKKTKAATTSLRSFNTTNNHVTQSINSSSVGLMATIENYQTLIHVMNSVIQITTNFLAQAIEWDGIQFRFGQSFGEDAEEVYDWILKINEALGINVQEFMQYSGLYASLLKGFGLGQEKVTEIAVGLTELSYDIWAYSNDRFKSVEEASEAIRSAITGEIEPIRNAGIALTEASLQEYIDSTHLAGISIEKLTEAQKAEVRYAAMVDSAMSQGIIGTYAREMNTAEGAVRNLSQTLKTLTQSLGSLFIPMLQVVVPYITAFVEILTDGVRKLASLLGIEIQKIDWSKTNSGVGGLADGAADAASGLGSAADAAKKLKNYTMGFDELNVINPDSGSKGSGGGAGGASDWGSGLDLKSIWDEGLLAQASKKVDEIKGNILGFLDEFKEELAIIGVSLGVLGVTKLITGLGEALQKAEQVDGVLGNIAKVATSGLVIGVQLIFQKMAFDSFQSEGGTLWDYLSGLLIGAGSSFILYKQWGAGGLVIGLGVTAYTAIKSVIDQGGVEGVEGVATLLTGLASAAGAVFMAWKKVAPVIGKSKIWIALKNAIIPAAKAIGSFVAGISAPVWAAIAIAVAAIGSAAYYLSKNWDKVVQAVKDFAEQNLAPKLDKIREHFSKIGETLAPLKTAFGFVVEAVKKLGGLLGKIDLSKVWDGILKGIEWFGGYLVSMLGGSIAAFVNVIVNVAENLAQIFSGWIQVAAGFVKFVIALFSGGDIEAALETMWDGVKDIFSGITGMIWGTLVSFASGYLSWATSLWDNLSAWYTETVAPVFTAEFWATRFNTIVEAFTTKMEEWKTSAKKKWGEITAWFNKTIKPYFTLEYWQGVYQSVVDAFNAKMDEWRQAAAKKWELIVAWYDETIAPVFTVAFWKGKFDTLVQAIRAKLDEFRSTASEKWSGIKSWYNSNVAPKFTKDFWIGKFEGMKNGFVSTIKNMVNLGVDQLNEFIDWLNGNLKFSWDGLTIKGKEVFPGGEIQLFTIPHIPRFENGGFLEDGLFTMNQGEIAGKFTNGRSVVANNEQIVAGIAEGVYSAVVAAMADSQSGRSEQAVNVYLDGKQIYTSVKRTESQRGVSLMGNQLGYTY